MSTEVAPGVSDKQAHESATRHHERTCRRCEGLLVEDRFMDMCQGGFLWGTGWRCVNCGNVLFGGIPRKEAQPGPAPSVDGEEQPVDNRPVAA